MASDDTVISTVQVQDEPAFLPDALPGENFRAYALRCYKAGMERGYSLVTLRMANTAKICPWMSGVPSGASTPMGYSVTPVRIPCVEQGCAVWSQALNRCGLMVVNNG